MVTPDDLEAGQVTRATGGDKLTWKFKSTGVRDVAVSVSDRYVWETIDYLHANPVRRVLCATPTDWQKDMPNI